MRVPPGATVESSLRPIRAPSLDTSFITPSTCMPTRRASRRLVRVTFRQSPTAARISSGVTRPGSARRSAALGEASLVRQGEDHAARDVVAPAVERDVQLHGDHVVADRAHRAGAHVTRRRSRRGGRLGGGGQGRRTAEQDGHGRGGGNTADVAAASCSPRRQPGAQQGRGERQGDRQHHQRVEQRDGQRREGGRSDGGRTRHDQPRPRRHRGRSRRRPAARPRRRGARCPRTADGPGPWRPGARAAPGEARPRRER